jgi:hypothetical protein
MQLLWGHDDTVWRWACRFFDGGLDRRSTWAIGIIDRRGALRGALLGDEVNAWTVEVTICAEQAISNDTAKAFFQAVFSRYWRLQVSTTKDNTTIKQNAPKWGFAFEGTAQGYYGPGRDALRYRMTAAECRWLHPKQKAIINGFETKGATADQRARRYRANQNGKHQDAGAAASLQSPRSAEPVRQHAAMAADGH